VSPDVLVFSIDDWVVLPLYEPDSFLDGDPEDEADNAERVDSQTLLTFAVIEHFVKSANKQIRPRTPFPSSSFHTRDLPREKVVAAVLQLCQHASTDALEKDPLRHQITSLLRYVASTPLTEGALMKAIEKQGQKNAAKKEVLTEKREIHGPGGGFNGCEASLAVVAKLMKVHISLVFGLEPFPSLLICFLQCNQFPAGLRRHLWQEMTRNNLFKLHLMLNDSTAAIQTTGIDEGFFVPFTTESYLWPLGMTHV
jgi:hypothetical protein